MFFFLYNPGAPDYNVLILLGNQYYNLGVPGYNVFFFPETL